MRPEQDLSITPKVTFVGYGQGPIPEQPDVTTGGHQYTIGDDDPAGGVQIVSDVKSLVYDVGASCDIPDAERVGIESDDGIRRFEDAIRYRE